MISKFLHVCTEEGSQNCCFGLAWLKPLETKVENKNLTVKVSKLPKYSIAEALVTI